MRELIILSLVTASIAFTISEAGIFTEVRALAKRTHYKLGELLSCGYCVSHWVAFFLVSIYQPRLFLSDFWLLDYFLTAIFIVWLAAFQWRMMVISGKIIRLLLFKAKIEQLEYDKERATIPVRARQNSSNDIYLSI